MINIIIANVYGMFMMHSGRSGVVYTHYLTQSSHNSTQYGNYCLLCEKHLRHSDVK